jgi:hypothetical protein
MTEQSFAWAGFAVAAPADHGRRQSKRDLRPTKLQLKISAT